MTIAAEHALRAPFPWYGGKRRVAPLAWQLLGADAGRYVEPFAGSLGVLLGRPGGARGLEVVNDLDGHIVNVWRALKHAPEETIGHADYPRTEHDLTARHLWLVNEGRGLLAAGLPSDPEWFDARCAGWWLYGIAMWIGGNFAQGGGPWTRGRISGNGDDGRGVRRKLPHLADGRGVHRQLPHLGDDGQGVHRQLPNLGDDGRGVIAEGIYDLARQLSARLRRVLVANGDWARVLSPAALRSPAGHTAVFLDPPYPGHEEYAGADEVWAGVTAWCETADPGLRVVLCGYTGDWDPPAGWHEHPYTARGTNTANRTREVMWSSPACGQTTLL